MEFFAKGKYLTTKGESSTMRYWLMPEELVKFVKLMSSKYEMHRAVGIAPDSAGGLRVVNLHKVLLKASDLPANAKVEGYLYWTISGLKGVPLSRKNFLKQFPAVIVSEGMLQIYKEFRGEI